MVFHRLRAGVDEKRRPEFHTPPTSKSRGFLKLPLKVSCKKCHSPVANEGNNMFLVLPTLVEFEGHGDGSLPDTFKPKFHQYYDTRIREIDDDLPKFGAERGAEPLNDAAKKMVAEEKKEKKEKEGKEKKEKEKEGKEKKEKKDKKESKK